MSISIHCEACSTTPNSPVHIETELSRDLGLTTALAIGVGTMIAAGIFTLSGLAIRNVGSAAIVAFLLAAVVATFTALTYCEFVSIYPPIRRRLSLCQENLFSPTCLFCWMGTGVGLYLFLRLLYCQFV